MARMPTGCSVTARRSRPGPAAEDGSHHREDEARVVTGGERPAPTVEHLDGLAARLDLGAEIRNGSRAQGHHESLPRLRLGMHQGFGSFVITRRTSIDQVA